MTGEILSASRERHWTDGEINSGSLIFLEEAEGSFGYAHLSLMDILNSKHFATREIVH